MDTLFTQTSRLALPGGGALELEYQLLRQLLLTAEGLPVCELYGIRVLERQGPDTRMYVQADLTLDYDQARSWLDRLARGAVTADTAADVLEDLAAEAAMV